MGNGRDRSIERHRPGAIERAEGGQIGTYLRPGGIQVFPNKELLGVKNLVEQIAGLIIQARVRQAVAAQYQIQEEQQAPNGALVLTFEL